MGASWPLKKFKQMIKSKPSCYIRREMKKGKKNEAEDLKHLKMNIFMKKTVGIFEIGLTAIKTPNREVFK